MLSLPQVSTPFAHIYPLTLLVYSFMASLLLKSFRCPFSKIRTDEGAIAPIYMARMRSNLCNGNLSIIVRQPFRGSHILSTPLLHTSTTVHLAFISTAVKLEMGLILATEEQRACDMALDLHQLITSRKHMAQTFARNITDGYSAEEGL